MQTLRRTALLLITALFAGSTARADASGTSFLRPTGSPEQGHFGSALAAEGTLVVVGAPSPGVGGGTVYVMNRNTNRGFLAWLETELRPTDVAAGDAYGASVALRGGFAAVGSPDSDAVAVDGGRVVVWQRGASDEDWTVDGVITPPVAIGSGRFGASVSLTQVGPMTLLAVGAPGSGYTWIFERQASGWSPHGSLFSPAGSSFDFGTSVSIVGMAVAVGAPGNPQVLGSGGRVYLYTHDGLAWNAAGSVSDSAGHMGARFGASVALGPAASELIVGSPAWADPIGVRGAAVFFERSGTTWTELMRFPGYVGEAFGQSVTMRPDTYVAAAKGADLRAVYFVKTATTWAFSSDLVAPNAVAGDLAGGGIALTEQGSNSAPVVLTGAPLQDSQGVPDSGGVHDMVWFGGGWTWFITQIGRNHTADDYCGSAVAIDGDLLALGSRGDAEAASSGGAVYVSRYSGTGFGQKAKLTAGADGAPGASLGSSVGAFGSRIAAGAPGEPSASGTLAAGAVFVFRESSSVWSREARLVPSDPVINARFGESVGFDGDLLAVGAPGALDDMSVPTGAAYVYRRQGSTWTLEDRIAPAAGDGFAFGLFGTSISADGTRIVVGAPLHPVQNFFEAGEVFVYALANGTWTLEDTLQSPSLQNFSGFGDSVAIHGNRLVVGEPEANTLGSGKVHLFERTAAGWQLVETLTASDGQNGDVFGTSVDLDGEAILVGAPLAGVVHSNGESEGASYLFQITPGGVVETCSASNSAGRDAGRAVALDDGLALVGAPGTDAVIGGGSPNSEKQAGLVEGMRVPDLSGPEIFCISTADTQGCTPWIDYSGVPSISASTPFVLTAQDCLNKKSALMMYSLSGRAALPWFGVTLCIAPPLGRTQIQYTGGSAGTPDCTGSLSWDVHAWIASGTDPDLAPGVTFYGQFRYRDPASSGGLNVSNAIEVPILP